MQNMGKKMTLSIHNQKINTMKRILLFTMALWLTMIGWAQTKEGLKWSLQNREQFEVIVADSAIHDYNLPPISTDNYWYYMQTILNPEHIGRVGPVTSISFLKKSGAACSRNIQFFIKATDYDVFYYSCIQGTPCHMLSVEPEDLFYTGNVIIPGADSVWVTIPLDHPFYYDGVSNLLIGVLDSSGLAEDDIMFQGGSLPIQYDYLCNRTVYLKSSLLYPNPITEAGLPNPYDDDYFSYVPMSHLNTYGSVVPTMKFAFEGGDVPNLVADPEQIPFGETPIGAWKHHMDICLYNDGFAGSLDAVDIIGSGFSVEGPNAPIDMPWGTSLTYHVSPSVSTLGEVNASFLATYSGGRETLSVPITANGFVPISPDVFELPRQVPSFPYTDSPSQLHNTYWLPGENEDGPDAVYQLTFSDDVLLNASVENGDNPKMALYKDDFNGSGGPHSDNAYQGPVLHEPDTAISGWLYYDMDQVLGYYYSLGGAKWAVKFTPEQLAPYQGCVMDKIRWCRVNDGGHLTLSIYMGGEDAPGHMVSKQELAQDYFPQVFGGSNYRWESVNLDEPVLLDVNQNLWLCYYTDDIPYGPVCSPYCGDPNSCWCLEGDTWTTIADLNDGDGCSWMIRAFVTNGEGSRELGTEGVIDQMTVEAGTYYLVASSTTEGFEVNIDTETIPLPEAACNPTPADGASDLMATMKLKWSLGAYTTAYRLLLGTANPPQEVVVDWTDALDTEYITGLLSNRTHYYWRVDERNSSGITEGPVWSFTTYLVPPTDLVADHDKLYEGDAVVLSWEAPARDLIGYNIYQNDVMVGSTTTTSYTVEDLAYNMDGHQFAVTSVYAEGVSVTTEPIVVYVTGLGSISGTVKEQDRITPIEGVTVKVNGFDELGLYQVYSFTTDSNGCYGGTLYAGSYKVSILKEGYQTMQSEVTISYQTENSDVDFVMEEAYVTVGAVVAEDLDDAVRVSWDSDPLPKEPEMLYYDNGYYATNIGNMNNMYWGISFPDMSEYEGMELTKIMYYDADQLGTITVNIYFGGITAPQRLVSTQEFATMGTGKFIEFELTEPVAIDGTESLWITCFSDNMQLPASACAMTEDPNGRWVSFDGVTWVDLYEYFGSMLYTWMLRAYLEDPKASSGRSLQFYNVYRSSCYTADEAELIATEVADTMFVDLAWDTLDMGVYRWGVSKTYSGNHVNSSRGARVSLLNEGFEGGALPEGWTRYGGSWPWEFTGSFLDGDAHITPHGGSYAAYANSDGESGTRNLVTPAIDLSRAMGASLDFFYVLPDWGGDVDALYVKYGTSPNGPWTTLWTASSATWSWTEATIDLTDLCGQTVYLDFADSDGYGYGGAIDDVTVTADIIPDGFEILPLINEGYEGGALPEGWTRYGGSWPWEFTGSFLDGDAHITPHGGSYAAYANSDGESGTRNLVTPAIDLSRAMGASLDFFYVLPDWGGDVDALYVKYGTSPNGPWTTLWTASSATWSWTEATIDLTDLCGQTVYLDFADSDGYGYGGAIDDVTVTALMQSSVPVHESAIVWSNCLDRDMSAVVDVTVVTNTGQSPEGTVVSFVNISEPQLGYDFETTLGADGYIAWDPFRKGTYLYNVSLLGYQSCGMGDTVEIYESTSFHCMLEETLRPVEDLYVSPTGWAMWDGDLDTSGDEFHYGFEDGTMCDWTLIDADGDGYDWKLGMAGGSPSIPGCGSTYCVYSESYDPAVGGLYPDNYLVSKRVLIGDGSVFSFYVCAQDEDYPHEHYGVAVSTLSNTDPVFFTTIWEETLTAKDGHMKVEGPRGSRAQGTWYYKEIDLSAYAGQEVYIALRHFGCYDMFLLDVDDIRLSNGRSSKNPMGYKVKLDGVYAGDVAEPFIQHDESWLVPYQTYVTSVAAVYATAMSDYVDYTWTYTPCEDYLGINSFVTEVEEGVVQLQWDGVDGVLGTMVWRDGELLTPNPVYGNSFTDTGLGVGDYEYCIRVVHDGMPDSTYYAMSCALCEEVLVTPTNVNEDEQQVIAVYPNPTRDGIVVKAAGMRRLRIVNCLGQLLYDREVNGDELPVVMGAYGSGVYVIQVTTINGVFERRVIVTD